MILALLFLLVVAATPAQAVTYYVATNGNDSNNGTAESTPKRTVAHCVSIMVAGDTCYVKNGTYNEGLIRFRRSGTQANPIKLLNYPGHAPKIFFVDPEGSNFDRILIQHSSGQNVPMGWIEIGGLELDNGHDGIKFHSLHDSRIHHLHIHDIRYMGILGIGGVRNTFDHNLIHHNGRFAACDAGTTTLCIQDHGLYMSGNYYTITNNIFYYHQGFGIQQNCASSFNASVNPSSEYAGASNWIVSDNTFTYSRTRGGQVIWGGACDNTRIENNIFYENNIERPPNAQGIEFLGAGGSSGMLIRNNHFYGSGSGATAAFSGTEPGDLVKSGNVINVSSPQFVNGGNNSLPASPDFRLTASAPVNMCLPNEFPNNSTCVVGAFKTVGSPTASMQTNVMTLNFPMSTAVPIQVPSTAGVEVSCTPNPTACPGSPSVLSAVKRLGTDSLVDITIGGIAGNACAAGQDWRVTYNSGAGAWTTSDSIGPAPGLSQKIFSFTNVLASNGCDGSPPPPPPPPPVGLGIEYLMDEGSGTTLNDATGNGLHGTLVAGAWDASGVLLTEQAASYVAVPWGSGVNPTASSFMIVFGVTIPDGNECVARTFGGTPFTSTQRLYISMLDCTWRIGIQGSNDATPSNLAVTPGRHQVVLKVDKDTPGGGTGTATLCVDAVCATPGGAQKTYTSYTLAGDFELGRLPGFTNGPGGLFEHFIFYPNASTSITDLFASFNAANPPTVGQFSQPAIQFQAVYLTGIADPPTNLGALNSGKTVRKGGAVAMVAKWLCDAGVNCEETATRWTYRREGSTLTDADSWPQVPNMETTDGIYMWGTDDSAFLNDNPITSSIVPGDTCTIVSSATQITASQIPSLTLAQTQCAMLRGIVRFSTAASGYYDIRLEKEGGVPFAGTYVYGRVTLIDPSANGGF